MKRFFNMRILGLMAILFVVSFVFADGETVGETVGLWSKINLWIVGIGSFLGGGLIRTVINLFLPKLKNKIGDEKWENTSDKIVEYGVKVRGYLDALILGAGALRDANVSDDEKDEIQALLHNASDKAANTDINPGELDEAVSKLQRKIGGTRRSA